MAFLAVIAPDGRALELPEENVPEALKHGYRLRDAAAAGPAPAEPAPAPPPTKYVPVISPDGRKLELPESNLQAAIAAGYEPVVGLGQQIRTGAEGLARGVSLSISDAVQAGGAGLGTALGHALADDLGPGAVPRAAGPGIDAPALPARGMFDTGAAQESLQGIRTRETSSPVTAAVTGVAGAVLPAILSGGTSAASGAAALTPAGYASLLGARVQAHLAQKAGIGALGRVGALAAGGALENATSSATQHVVDGLLSGDYELSAERMLGGLGEVLWDAGLGALSGGTVGGAIEGGQKAYGAVRGQLARRAAGQAAGQAAEAAAPSLTWDLTLEPAAAAEAAGPLLAKDLPTLADNSNSRIVQAARGSVDGFEDVQQGAVRGIRDDYDEFLKMRADINGRANIGAKRADASKVMGTPEQLAAARQATNAMLDETEIAIKTMTELDGFKGALDEGGMAAFKRVELAADEARKIINQKLDEGLLGEAHMVLDDFKRVVGRGQNTKNSLAKHKLRNIYDNTVKPAGENEAAWGQLAVNQKRVNPAWAESIRRDGDDEVQAFTRKSGERSLDPWEDLEQSNSHTIGALLNGLGKAETEATEEAFRKHLRAAVVDAKTRAEVWGTATDIARATKMTAAVERIENRMNAVAFAAKDKKAWEKVMRFAPGSAGGVLQGVAKLGQLTLSPIQRMADAAVKQQVAVESAAKSVGDVLLGAGSPKALKAAIATNRVQGAVSQARALQDPQSAESGRLRQAALELAHDDPAFAQVMEAKQRQQAGFIAQKAGPAMDDGDPFAKGPAPMDPVSAAQLARYVDATDDPGGALTRVSQGLGTAEDLEVLQTLYPRMYDTFVKLVNERLARTKTPPTPAQRQQLHRATGIPMGREQQPDALLFLQQVGNAPGEEMPAPKGGKSMQIDPDEHYGPRSDQILGGD
jgi:hypothetical protein